MYTIKSVSDIYCRIDWDKVEHESELIELISNKRFAGAQLQCSNRSLRLTFIDTDKIVDVYDREDCASMKLFLQTQGIPGPGYHFIDVNAKFLPPIIHQLITDMPFKEFPKYEGGSTAVRIKKFLKYHPDLVDNHDIMLDAIIFLKKNKCELYHDRIRNNWWHMQYNIIDVCSSDINVRKASYHINLVTEKIEYPFKFSNGKEPKCIFWAVHEGIDCYVFDNGSVVRQDIDGNATICIPTSQLTCNEISIGQVSGTIAFAGDHFVITTAPKKAIVETTAGKEEAAS